MHATCATTDCQVPDECGGEAAASCAAFTITLFGGRDIAGGPICATCAGYRWTSLAVIAPTESVGVTAARGAAAQTRRKIRRWKRNFWPIPKSAPST